MFKANLMSGFAAGSTSPVTGMPTTRLNSSLYLSCLITLSN
jgi:hypothetical protein